MKTTAVIIIALIALMATSVYAENANRQEVLMKCAEASKLIQAKGIDMAMKEIGNKSGPFVWKDTYVFLMDMDGKMLAHPIKPELTQQETLVQVKDTAGKPLFIEFIKVANSTEGKGWVDYLWPKPGEEKPVGKSSYIQRVPGTQYFVGAGIYK